VPHPYPIREIARQAGLSEATVDRVLNRRGGVRQSTVDEVHRAVADLHRQRSQMRLTGRTFFLDLVVDAPARFAAAVRAALESQLPLVRPATFRARFHLAEAPPVPQLVATLEGIARRGSQGVVLKAPDHPQVVAAVERLADAGIPVITLVTDLPTSRRVAYVGLDNRAATRRIPSSTACGSNHRVLSISAWNSNVSRYSWVLPCSVPFSSSCRGW
jgi:LacI family transcriptional regulator